MFHSEGLLRLTHYQSDGDLHLKRPFHYSTHFDHTDAQGDVVCEYPASRRPPPWGYYSSLLGMIVTGSMCAFSRRQHEEKIWMTNLILSIGYWGSWKFHKAENDMIGHSSGVWCDGIGISLCLLRYYGGTGAPKTNRRLLVFYSLLGWFDWGRCHMWVEHTSEIKKNIIPLKKTVVSSMWAEYVPPHQESALIVFRKINEIDDGDHHDNTSSSSSSSSSSNSQQQQQQQQQKIHHEYSEYREK